MKPKNEPKSNRKVSKKEFGNYLKIRNHNTIVNCYRAYLFAVNKPPSSILTVNDIFRIDGVYID